MYVRGFEVRAILSNAWIEMISELNLVINTPPLTGLIVEFGCCLAFHLHGIMYSYLIVNSLR